MVVKEASDTPLEVPIMKTRQTEAKKYVIVKNHVRELPNKHHIAPAHVSKEENSSENETPPKKLKTPVKKNKQVIQAQNEQNSSSSITSISQEDINELRTVYNQCKAVINRIEAKYGHLLNIEDSGSSSETYKMEMNFEEECHCRANKKIIFDEDGQQLEAETDSENHICLKKLKRTHSASMPSILSSNIAVEYDEQAITLPDDLPSLTNILRDSKIEVSYRNHVINKIKSVKLEYLNEIRFNRPSLIEKLKSNEKAEVFEFEGANLFSLPGYPDWK